jgi:hypothetical protein
MVNIIQKVNDDNNLETESKIILHMKLSVTKIARDFLFGPCQ